MRFAFQLSSHLPLWLLHGLGTVLGWLIYLASPVYRQRFNENTRQAGLSWVARFGAVAAAGKLVTELPWVWLRPPSQVQAQVQWDGAEHVERAMQEGRGIIFLTPHIGCFEVTPQSYAARFGVKGPEIVVLYRPSRFAWLERVLHQVRHAPGMRPVPTTLAGVRQLLKALRSGGAVGLLPDQVPGQDMGVWAPFFGRPAYTMTLAIRLARQTRAVVLIARSERLSFGRGFRVHVAPPVLLGEGDDVAAATLLNQQLESSIRQRPDQYLWAYARYKQPRAAAPQDAGKL